MTTVFEKREDCSEVEKFIWDCVQLSYGGEFIGIKKLGFEELTRLQTLCERSRYLQWLQPSILMANKKHES